MAAPTSASSPSVENLPESFKSLAEQWRRETGMHSSITKKLNHPAYQKIIEMGTAAVPLILEEMKARPAFWFKALETITGTSPIPAGKKVDVEEATAAWLAWGKDRGYTKE